MEIFFKATTDCRKATTDCRKGTIFLLKRYNLFPKKLQFGQKSGFEPTIFHAIMDFNMQSSMQSWGTIIFSKKYSKYM